MSIKESLGFEPYGYITLFKNDKKEYNDHWKLSNARYSKYWGWYYPCLVTEFNLPFGVEPVQLFWDKISIGEELKTENEITEEVDTLLYDGDDSEYLGNVGDEIEACVSIKVAIPMLAYYGNSIFYVLDDANGNHIVWKSTIALQKNKLYLLSGTIKQLKKYKNQKQTVISKGKIKEIEQ